MAKLSKGNPYCALDQMQLSRPEKIQSTNFKNLTIGMQETTLKRATNANPFTHILRKDLPVNDVISMVMALLR